MSAVAILYAAFNVSPDKVICVEDDDTAAGTREDRFGVTLAFGSEGDPDLLLRLPDETAERVILKLLEHSPRLSRRMLDRARHPVTDRMQDNAHKVRERLDPGPLPIGKENE